MPKPSVARRQAMQRAVDRIVHHFKVNAWAVGHPDAGLYHPRAHKWVRVYLQRVLGWAYVKIEVVYGVPARSAKRWQKEGRGFSEIGEAVAKNELGREEFVKDLLGLD